MLEKNIKHTVVDIFAVQFLEFATRKCRNAISKLHFSKFSEPPTKPAQNFSPPIFKQLCYSMRIFFINSAKPCLQNDRGGFYATAGVRGNCEV
jgi:hypothetical protein